MQFATVALVLLSFTSLDGYLLTLCGAEAKMSQDRSAKAVPKAEKSELQKFASWFHQDWDLIYPNFYEGAQMYLTSLSSRRRVKLSNELQDFLRQYGGEPSKLVLRAWFRLGAEAWPPELEIANTLHDFVRLMGSDTDP